MLRGWSYAARRGGGAAHPSLEQIADADLRREEADSHDQPLVKPERVRTVYEQCLRGALGRAQAQWRW